MRDQHAGFEDGNMRRGLGERGLTPHHSVRQWVVLVGLAGMVQVRVDAEGPEAAGGQLPQLRQRHVRDRHRQAQEGDTGREGGTTIRGQLAHLHMTAHVH